VRTIFEDDDGTMWLGTVDGGLCRFDPKKESFKNYTHNPNNPNSINDDRIYTIIKGDENLLWMATGNGIASFDTETELFTRYYAEPENPEGLSYHLIMSVFKDHSGIIWVATYGGGLNKLDPKTGIFTRYTEKDGLPNNVIYGIIEDEQYKLWLSTNKGISVFNPKTEEFKNYSVEDGLQDNEFNSGAYFKDKLGNIYFGGMKGVNQIKNSNITDNQFIPPVVIYDFQLFNKSVSPLGKEGESKVLTKSILETDIIKLSYKQNSFSFLFSALDYRFPEKNEYMYILENFDKNWTKVTSRRFVTYTSLPAGEYIFKVKGSNSDGIWNEKGRSIKLIIEPPFWETWWFKFLVVFFIVFSLISFYIIRTREIKRKNKELENTVQDRTREIQEKNHEISAQNEELKKSKDEIEFANKKLKELNQFKEEMAAMIVHDLKNPLNLIIGLAENETVKQSGKQMLNMVMNILDVQKYEQTEIKLQRANFQADIISESALEQVCLLYEQKNIKVENLVNEYVVVVDPDLIERVFVNILTNAIKYTPINGKITLESEKSEDELIQIKITDNGPGIPEDKLEKIFLKFEQVVAKESGIARSTGMGLTFCKMVIEAHGGEIGVESELEKGTSFWFTLPAGQEIEKINHTKTKLIEETSLKLTNTDKEILRQYALKLQNLEVYELSDIEKVIDLIDISKSQNLGQWKKEMDNALHTMNQEKYLELIKLIEE
jgi:signal transduction histidine kinase